MRRSAILLSLTLVVGVVLGAIGDRLLSAQQEPLKRTALLKTDLAGMQGREGQIIRVEFAPGAAAGKHYHPGHELVYVMEGSGTLEVEGKPPRQVKAGDTAYLPPKQVHDAKNGSKSAPLRVLVFSIHPKGEPPVVEVKK